MPSDEDSDVYRPTSYSPISYLTNRFNKDAMGLVCPKCGHLAKEEDELIGNCCPKCLQNWLIDQGIEQLIPIKELTDERDSALFPTIKVDKSFHEKTTVVFENKDKEKTVINTDTRVTSGFSTDIVITDE